MISLAEMIEEDYHQDLLEKGNLRPARKSAEWTGSNQYTSEGYLARVAIQLCRACGSSTDHVLSVAHCERNPRGDTRELALSRGFQIPHTARKRLVTSTEQVEACAPCLLTRGFQP